MVLSLNLNAQTSLAATSHVPSHNRPQEETKLITDLFHLQTKLPQYSSDTIAGLLNVNRGPENGRMQTLGLVRTVQANEVYTIDEGHLKTSQELFAIDLEAQATKPPIITQPDHLEFTAEWNKQALSSGKGNNVLGDNGGLYFKESTIRVPVVKATAETLAYYGAVLIPKNTAVRFPSDKPFPLWKMHVGPNYVKDFLMTKEGGGGFYLEFHHDQPHFHMIVKGDGYYLLAKKVSDHTYHLTAFELSDGQAVYTKKGAIHCDAALKGDIICGYSSSDDCETVLLVTKKDNSPVNIEFV